MKARISEITVTLILSMLMPSIVHTQVESTDKSSNHLSSSTEISTADNSDNVNQLASDVLQTDEELIVVVLYRNKTYLSDGLIAYPVNGEIALPLEQFLFLLEFAIQVEAGGKKAKGWFISEERLFKLNLQEGTVHSDKKDFAINNKQVKIVQDELFVPISLLSEWFPLDIDSHLRTLEINVSPREETAIDQRLKRQKKEFGKTYRIRANNPKLYTPYSVFSVPALAVNLGVGYNASDDGSNHLNGNYSLRSAGDLAFMHSKMSIFGTNEDITDARLSLSRKDPDGGIFGKLNATEIEMGDISSSYVPLISGNVGGRGIRIKRNPGNYISGQEMITLEGSLETGYDVELYRNNILINAQYADATNSDGYKFENIELFSGQNEFRLEFYGPQGQRRSETKRYFVGAGQLKKGEVNYDISLSEPGKTAFGISKSDDTYKKDALSAEASLAYGINSNFSAETGITISPLSDSDEVRKYAHGSLHTAFSGFYTHFNAAADDKGGTAFSINASTQINETDFSGTYEKYFNDFHSNKTASYSDSNALNSRWALKAERNKSNWLGKTTLQIGLGLSQVKFNDGVTLQEVEQRTSLGYRYFSFSNFLSYNDLSSSSEKTTDGNMIANINLRDLHLYTQADYSISPDSTLETYACGVNYQLFSDYNAGLSFSENRLSNISSIIGSLTKEFKYTSAGLSASFNENEDGSSDHSVYLTLGFNTFTDSRTGKTDFSNRTSLRSAAQLTAFVDENANGIFDKEENTLPDVNIYGFGDKIPPKTNRKGQALAYKTHIGEWMDIGLDGNNMPTPNMKPATSGVSILPRAGKISEVYLPIVRTADIEGTVFLLKGQATTPIPLGNIEIQAIQMNPFTGKELLVGTTLTAVDGFYALPQIQTGKTTIRINPEQLRRLNVEGKASFDVLLDSNDDNFVQQNFHLKRITSPKTD